MPCGKDWIYSNCLTMNWDIWTLDRFVYRRWTQTNRGLVQDWCSEHKKGNQTKCMCTYETHSFTSVLLSQYYSNIALGILEKYINIYIYTMYGCVLWSYGILLPIGTENQTSGAVLSQPVNRKQNEENEQHVLSEMKQYRCEMCCSKSYLIAF